MSSVTSSGLMIRMRDTDDDEAWDRFFDFYAPLIIRFSRENGCPEEMANEILQETMVQLLKQMPNFTYDRQKGRFRSYLLKVVHRRIQDAIRRAQRTCSLERDTQSGWVQGIPDPNLDAPGEDWDKLWDRQLLRHALRRVQDKVQPQTFQSFEMYVLDGHPVETVQKELGIADRNTVYQHRNRVIRLLRHEANLLKEEMGE